MLRIGEFSALSSITINMLRHYDKIGLLIPCNVDSISGYRYYDKEQLVQANRIVALKTMGFGLDEIKETMDMSESEVDRLLEMKLQEKYDEISKIKSQITQIELAVNTTRTAADYALSIVKKVMPAIWVVSFRDLISEYPEEGRLWGELQKECINARVKISERAIAMAINHGYDEKSGMMDVEVLLTLDREYIGSDRITISKRPKHEAASVIFQGAYAKIGDINTIVAEWIEKNHFEIVGEGYSIYHNSPGNSSQEKELVTELCFPINKK